jgi:hypothetical protein
MQFTLPHPQFSFAGFVFPKFAFTLPKGDIKARIERMRKPLTGPYYHSPKPEEAGSARFYLEGDFMPTLRWEWCDEVDDVRIDHTGWLCNRGFIAGWSIGKRWASGSEPHIYATQREAAYAADKLAERVAEDNRARQEEEYGSND